MMARTIALGQDEHVATIIRKHPFHLVVVGVTDMVVFLSVVTLIVTSGFILRATEVFAIGAGQAVFLGVYLTAFVGLLLWMHFFSVWTDHWLDAWVVTNKRVIDIEQRGFFSRQVSSFPIERIQDVTFESTGVLATWLGYGDVRIQTASLSSDFIMRGVGDPAKVKEILMAALSTTATASPATQ